MAALKNTQTNPTWTDTWSQFTWQNLTTHQSLASMKIAMRSSQTRATWVDITKVIMQILCLISAVSVCTSFVERFNSRSMRFKSTLEGILTTALTARRDSWTLSLILVTFQLTKLNSQFVPALTAPLNSQSGHSSLTIDESFTRKRWTSHVIFARRLSQENQTSKRTWSFTWQPLTMSSNVTTRIAQSFTTQSAI